jgi:hypothetical protein
MKSGSPGMDCIHGDVVEAAASEPLVADDDYARFEHAIDRARDKLRGRAK